LKEYQADLFRGFQLELSAFSASWFFIQMSWKFGGEISLSSSFE
jgi:hypothetical protein